MPLIAAAHRTLGRNALPRAAALTGAAFVADVTDIANDGRFVRLNLAPDFNALRRSSQLEM